VAQTAREFGAREIVAEKNQGGEMVRTVLAHGGCETAIRLVHASRGKAARAEPVAALYEQGRVVHCGAFPALEEELMALGSAKEGGRSPDRADALVWAVTHLLPAPRAGPRIRIL
jgi:phage terminase large subunit-like protein